MRNVGISMNYYKIVWGEWNCMHVVPYEYMPLTTLKHCIIALSQLALHTISKSLSPFQFRMCSVFCLHRKSFDYTVRP